MVSHCLHSLLFLVCFLPLFFFFCVSFSTRNTSSNIRICNERICWCNCFSISYFNKCFFFVYTMHTNRTELWRLNGPIILVYFSRFRERFFSFGSVHLWKVYMIMHVMAHSSMQTNTKIKGKRNHFNKKSKAMQCEWRELHESDVKREEEAFYACSFFEFGLIVGIVSAVKFSSGFKVPFVAFRSKDQFFSFLHCIDVVSFVHTHTHTSLAFRFFICIFISLRKSPLYCRTTKVKIKMKLQLKCCTFTELMAQ